MNNKKNKESVNPWVLRLFKQSGASVAAAHDKTYYAHRYHDQTLHKRSPFSDLFSGAEKNLTELPHSADFQRFFESRSPLSKIQPEIFPTMDSILPGLLKEQSDPAGDASIGPHLTVVNSYDETPDTKTFYLAGPTGRTFDYLPGQYIILSTVIHGQEYKRSYSLASSPSRPRSLAITVKRASNGGIVSNWLNDNLQIGDTVAVKGPFGKFSCALHAPQKILFLAAGSGIVPIMSMLRWLADTDAPVDVQLLLSFRSPKDIIYRDELQLIVARHKNINMVITLTTNEIARYSWSGLTWRVNEKMIRQTIPDLPERTVYLCGPDAFMADCKRSLLKLTVPPEKLFCESFTVNSPAANSENSGVSQPARSPTGTYSVIFAKSGKTIAADGRITLLELAEKSGIAIAHECRSGTCGECMIKCLKGKVEMTDQAEIDARDRKKGWVYICCAYPASNIVLDI